MPLDSSGRSSKNLFFSGAAQLLKFVSIAPAEFLDMLRRIPLYGYGNILRPQCKDPIAQSLLHRLFCQNSGIGSLVSWDIHRARCTDRSEQSPSASAILDSPEGNRRMFPAIEGSESLKSIGFIISPMAGSLLSFGKRLFDLLISSVILCCFFLFPDHCFGG